MSTDTDKAKQLLDYFGVPYHDAPGEAEAECALLQQEGIVDAVLTEDVDALMFGCGLSLRRWSPEGPRGSIPTHVMVHELKKCELKPKEMILVALLSGGDYKPEGLPRFGVKIACEAARAGFGASLCRIPFSDVAGIQAWRQSLSHELQTNESGHFSCKHKTLRIPDDFPDKNILRCYLAPMVSSPSQVSSLRERLRWRDADITGLRRFLGTEFEWLGLPGAKKLIKSISEPTLIRILIAPSKFKSPSCDLIKEICGERVSDELAQMAEYRISYVPLELAPIDLDAEQDGVFPSDGESEGQDEAGASEAGVTRCRLSTYDPTKPQRAWIPGVLLEAGAPGKLAAWKKKQLDAVKASEDKTAAQERKKLAAKSRKLAAETRKTAAQKRRTGGMKEGALDAYVRISKPKIDRDGGSTGRRHASPRATKLENQPPVRSTKTGKTWKVHASSGARPGDERSVETTPRTTFRIPDHVSDVDVRHRTTSTLGVYRLLTKDDDGGGDEFHLPQQDAYWGVSDEEEKNLNRPSCSFNETDDADTSLPEIFLGSRTSNEDPGLSSCDKAPGPSSTLARQMGISFKPISFPSSSPPSSANPAANHVANPAANPAVKLTATPTANPAAKSSPQSSFPSEKRKAARIPDPKPRVKGGRSQAVMLRDSLEGSWRVISTAEASAIARVASTTAASGGATMGASAGASAGASKTTPPAWTDVEVIDLT